MPKNNRRQPRTACSRRMRKKGRRRDLAMEAIPCQKLSTSARPVITSAVKTAVWISSDMKCEYRLMQVFCNYRITQCAEAFDGNFYHIAGGQDSDSGWSAGE